FMLTRRETYHDTGFDYAAANVKKNAPRWIKALETHGFVVKLSAAAARSAQLFHLSTRLGASGRGVDFVVLAFTVTPRVRGGRQFRPSRLTLLLGMTTGGFDAQFNYCLRMAGVGGCDLRQSRAGRAGGGSNVLCGPNLQHGMDSGMTPNVELTGAARLYRAASG
ncbi:MAG: hypothetical protein Q8M09_12255, partial [Pseudomonadota bacterium]|nr:hypothetical protein [Pseudomonadota bacterium]